MTTLIKALHPASAPSHRDSLLLRPKILYFFAFLQQYSFYAFRSVFFDEYFGYNPSQTGMIYSFSAAASFIGMTAWSNTADSTRKPKLVFLALVFGSFVTFMSLYLKHLLTSFYVVLSLICIYSFFNFGMNPILSNTVLEMLSDAGEVDKSIYGRQVVFGSFAYILTNFCQGLAKDHFGVESIFVIFPASSIFLLVAVLYAFPSDSKHAMKLVEKQQEQGIKSKASGKGDSSELTPPWWHVLRSPRFVLFLMVIFLTGCARSIMSAFLPYYCKQNLKLSGLNSALIMISGVTLEMLSFVMAPLVSGLGPYWMLVLAQVIMAVRAWAYVFVPASPDYFAVFMLIELLKGAAFGLTHLAGVRIARESAPPGLEATAQGFYEGFYAQIPAIISVALGGVAIKAFGIAALFQYTAVGISFSCALVIFVFWQNGKLRVKK